MKPAPEKPVEIGAPIQPDASAEGRLTELRENPAANLPAASATLSEAVLPTQSALDIPQEPAPKPQETPAGSGAPQIGEPAEPKARQGELVDLDRVDAAPSLTKRVEPKYPPIALRSGAGGTVTVNALISETGTSSGRRS